MRNESLERAAMNAVRSVMRRSVQPSAAGRRLSRRPVKFIRRLAAVVTAFTLAGCATTVPRSGTELCDQFSKYVAAASTGKNSFVELRRQGAWLVDHAKLCVREDSDPAAVEFCSWLMERTSTEFMEATVTLAIACVQGQQVRGYIGNTGIERWEGTLKSYSPRFDAENVSVQMAWRITAGSGSWDDFLRIEVIPE